MGFFFCLLIAVLAVHFHLQRKARFLADEMLAGNTEKFNRQIKANAWTALVRSGIWGLLFLIDGIWGWQQAEAGRFKFFFVILIFLGLFFFFWGFKNFSFEMKRKKDLR